MDETNILSDRKSIENSTKGLFVKLRVTKQPFELRTPGFYTPNLQI